MMYLESKYNYCVKDGEQYIIYNSLSGKVAIGNKPINEMDLQSANNELITHRFVKDSQEDEQMYAIKKFYDYQYDPKLNAVLIITKQCNFRCKYCYEEHKVDENTIFANFTQYLQKQLTKYTGINISWFGGEPMICFDQIIYYSQKWKSLCKKSMRTFSASITTNGYLLTVDRFKALLHAGIINYQITIDGIERTHDNLRILGNGQGTFNVIINNLRTIRDNCRGHFNIVIRVNVSSSVLECLDEVIEFLWEEFGRDKRFSFFFTLIKDWGGNCKENLENELLENTKEKEMYYKMLNHTHILNYAMYYDLLSSGLCFAMQKNSMVVEPNSDIRKCTVFENNNNLVGKIDAQGKVYNSDIKCHTVTEKSEKCKKCFLWANCFGHSCPESAQIRKPPNCTSLKYNADILLKLLKKVDEQYDLKFIRY